MSSIDVRRTEAFAHVTLQRPGARNAFDASMIEELRVVFETLAAEDADGLRGVVLAGAGEAFCAGADITWMRSAIGLSLEDNERDAARMQAMFLAIDACPVPVVARVHGAALGGGMGLLAVSDIVVATADATFGFTETKLGIIPAVISSFVVPKIGESHARALFATGERFGAERALRIGLVHDVMPDLAALDARIETIVGELGSAGPTAVRGAKDLVGSLRRLGPEESRQHLPRRIAEQRTGAEGQEGLAAFLEKRPPGWRI